MRISDWSSDVCSSDLTRALRAGHCIDLPLILGDEAAWGQMPLIAGLPWHEVHAAGRSMRTMIGSFARTGTPSDEAGRPWPPADRPRRLPRYEDSRTGLTAAQIGRAHV